MIDSEVTTICADSPSEANLYSLIERLLQEPFAAEHHFEQMTLENAGEILEGERDKYELIAMTEAELQAESFHRCKETYCLILMELERLELHSLLTEKLEHLRDRKHQTLILSLPESEQMGIDFEKDVLPVLEEKIWPAPIEIESKPLLPMEIVADQAESPVITADSGDTFGCPDTKSYMDLASQMRTHGVITSNACANRLYGLSLCFSIESECLEKIRPSLSGFWPRRQDAIKAILLKEPKRFELSPELRSEMEILVSGHHEFLFEGRFPWAAVINSLKYIAHTSDPAAFMPTLMDMATLLLFLGQERLAGAQIRNAFGLSGLAPSEMTELAFRLMRAQKIKVKLLNASVTLDDSNLDQLQSDQERIFMFLSVLESSVKEGAEEKKFMSGEDEELQVA